MTYGHLASTRPGDYRLRYRFGRSTGGYRPLRPGANARAISHTVKDTPAGFIAVLAIVCLKTLSTSVSYSHTESINHQLPSAVYADARLHYPQLCNATAEIGVGG
jgi:hypothetical protein